MCIYRSKKVPAAQALFEHTHLLALQPFRGTLQEGALLLHFLLHSFFSSVGFPEIGSTDVGFSDLGYSDFGIPLDCIESHWLRGNL